VPAKPVAPNAWRASRTESAIASMPNASRSTFAAAAAARAGTDSAASALEPLSSPPRIRSIPVAARSSDSCNSRARIAASCVFSRAEADRAIISASTFSVRSTASLELFARRRTSLRTTPNPAPCSPARAASIAALSDSSFD
jgi:hypothetical protein